MLDIVRKRRSVRRYQSRMVSPDLITQLLDAARWAPSGLNNQPWRFLVLHGEDKDALARFTRSGSVILSASAAIVVCLDNAVSYHRDKDLMSVGAFIQNILLDAADEGLGTCWLGEILNRRKEVEEHLGLEARYELMAVVTVGYPDERDPGDPERKAREELEIKRG
jgi:nitroreductase